MKKKATRARPKRPRQLIYQVDLHGMTWDEAERRLRAAPREAANAGSRILKIIHGQGRTTGSNVLQVKVRGWLATNPFPFRAAIPGEAYTISNPETIQMRDAIGQFPDSDLNATNAGVTIVWLR
jgi:hypothetical protein